MGTEADEQRSPGNAPGSAKIGDYVSWSGIVLIYSWEGLRIPSTEKKS